MAFILPHAYVAGTRAKASELNDNFDAIKAVLDTTAAGQIIVADAASEPRPVGLTGDASLSAAGVLSLGAGVVGTAELADNAVTDDKLATLTGASLRREDTLNVPNSTETAVTFTTEQFDTDSMVVPGGSLITINTPGLYLVTFGLRWAPNNVGRRETRVRLNDVTYLPVGEGGEGTTNGQVHHSGSFHWPFDLNDNIEVRVTQTSGSSLAIQAAHFTAVLVGQVS